ncbi:MAG: radical SAM protein [Sporomusaceae bacterium]|nr:radical SAM protein [Sporomusaceae bacterium]
MRYELQDHCILVEGAARGAIYDFKEGKVFSVNKGAVELLQKCRAAAIDEVIDAETAAGKKYFLFLDSLTAKGLGAFYTAKRSGGAGEKLAAFLENEESKPALEFLWLELTNACNNRCLHCYSESAPANVSDTLPHERWLSLIKEAKEAGATAIQFIGGEPLLYPKWQELVKKAAAENYEQIEIFTNATLIKDQDIEFFRDHKISIATTIYADTAPVHDAVTLNPGSFAKTRAAIDKILAAGIPLRIASVIMKRNEGEAENIMALCRSLGVESGLPDAVRPSGRGGNAANVPDAYRKRSIKPPFYTDEASFLQAQKYHSCLKGKIAVTSAGDVIPCIFARDKICANVRSAPLSEALGSSFLQESWRVTKDKVEKCSACEYRYACVDCRPLAQASGPDNNWLAPPLECAYDPYTGKWAK